LELVWAGREGNARGVEPVGGEGLVHHELDPCCGQVGVEGALRRQHVLVRRGRVAQHAAAAGKQEAAGPDQGERAPAPAVDVAGHRNSYPSVLSPKKNRDGARSSSVTIRASWPITVR